MFLPSSISLTAAAPSNSRYPAVTHVVYSANTVNVTSQSHNDLLGSLSPRLPMSAAV